MAMTFLFVSVFLSVRPLVQYRYCVKTTFHIIKLFPPSSFWAQLRPALQNSKVNSLSWGVKCIWGIMGFWKDTLFDRNTRIRHEIDPQLLLISKEVPGRYTSVLITMSDLESQDAIGPFFSTVFACMLVPFDSMVAPWRGEGVSHAPSTPLYLCLYG